MGKEDAKTQSDKRIRNVKMQASVGWWDRFERWMALHGHQSVPEGIRAAVNECTSRTDLSQV